VGVGSFDARNVRGDTPNSVRNARLKLEMSPKPHASATSTIFEGSTASRVAASRSRARRTYWCGVTPATRSKRERRVGATLDRPDGSGDARHGAPRRLMRRRGAPSGQVQHMFDEVEAHLLPRTVSRAQQRRTRSRHQRGEGRERRYAKLAEARA
jgi:hypothetical protein